VFCKHNNLYICAVEKTSIPTIQSFELLHNSKTPSTFLHPKTTTASLAEAILIRRILPLNRRARYNTMKGPRVVGLAERCILRVCAIEVGGKQAFWAWRDGLRFRINGR
jgi:hypothetical protein